MTLVQKELITQQLKLKWLDKINKKENVYKVFISGGMSNVPDYREKFQEAKKELLNIGFTHIITPVEIDDQLPEDMPLEEKFGCTSSTMMQCDAVYFISGFKDSTGAMKEYDMIMRDGTKDVILKDRSDAICMYNVYKERNEQEPNKVTISLINIMLLY